MSAPPDDDLIEETIVLAGRELLIRRPRDSESLLDEAAFEAEEFLPYWADLWPSSYGLARQLAGRALHGARVVELGCGLGLPAIAAAAAGGRVLATDWSADAVAYTAHNAALNEVELETAVVAWAHPEALLARAPFDLVIGADLLYEERNVGQLLDLVPRLMGERGEAWIADSGRPLAGEFLAAAAERFELSARADPEQPRVQVHRLRPRAAG